MAQNSEILVIVVLFCFFHRIAAKHPLLISSVGLHPNYIEEPEDVQHQQSLSSSDKRCDMMFLQRKQRKMCRRDKGIANTLMEAINLSRQECEFQFSDERWNCSLTDQFRLNILKKGEYTCTLVYHPMSQCSMPLPKR